MKALIPYLFFDGNCKDAMGFYKECFGGNLEVMTYENAPPESCAGMDMEKDKVMHACLRAGNLSLMASDGMDIKQGSNFNINIDCESLEQIEKLFKKLSEKGQAVMPLEDAFWGNRFGIAIDQFGIKWMLNCPLN